MRISDQSSRHEASACLACGATVDAASQIQDEGEEAANPTAGDITVCLRCGHLMAYADDKGGLRELTGEEQIELAGDPRIVRFNTIRGPAMKASEVQKAQAEAAKRSVLNIWTVYNRPLDYPLGYIARRFEVAGGENRPTADTLTGELEELRAIFWQAGLLKLTGSPEDEPQIVESWV